MAGYHAKKRLGQNFLKSEKVIRHIIEVVDPMQDQAIIEIGPGRGALTLPLAESGANLVAVEFDEDVIGYLNKLLRNHPNATILNQDFLQFEPDPEEIPRFSIVGNLPYNITSPVLDWCVKHQPRVERAVFMVQKEMASRVSAGPGSKDWSPLSILTQLYFDINFCFDVSPKHFHPAPKVTSSVILLEPIEVTQVKNPSAFETVVRKSFTQRRKLLRNNLVPDVISDNETADRIFVEIGLDRKSRAEQLSTESFLKLTDCLISHNLL